ncbi:MAG: alpha/beta fold hydrolase [Chloroflexi bacterium]|nr:alpha/beta fold hydrolase [Chloroflexota bacterium]
MRPLVLIGGYLTGPGDFAELATALQQPAYGYQVFVAPIGRLRWALTRDWDFRPVLAILRATVERALASSGADQVDILAHSVGGTVARMYLGDQPYLGQVYGGRRYVRNLVMLGTPHHSQEYWTRRSVGFVNNTYPGAFYPEIRYVSVVGRAIQGNPQGSVLQRMARNSYVMVSGKTHARAWGDGITTLHCAALGGAEYLVVDGVSHSPLHGRPWYGDQAGLARWGRVLRKEALTEGAVV